MRWPCRSPSRSSTVIALGLLGLGLSSGRAAAQAIAVVVNGEVQAEQVTVPELNNLFTFTKRSWPGGQRVTLFLPPVGSPARAALLKSVYHMDDAPLRRFLLEKVYQGDIDVQPRVATSEEELVGLIASTPGGITLISADKAALAKLKILKVSEKLPRDSGYQIRP